MTAIALLAVIIAVVALGAWLRQRRSDRAISSIDRHRSALTTLATVQRGNDLRGRRSARSNEASGRPLPKVDPRIDHVHAEVRESGERVYVFDDAKPYEAPEALAEAEQRRVDWAITHMGSHHRARHPLGLWVAVGVLAVAVALGAVVEHQASVPPVVTLPQTTTSTSSTTTTLPPLVDPTSATTGAATYAVANPTYAVTLTPASPCWVQITATNAKTTLFAETIPAHKATTFSLTQSSAVSIGSPSGVKAALDGAPLRLPRLASPTVLTFHVAQPSTSSTVPASSTSTTTTLPPNVLTG